MTEIPLEERRPQSRIDFARQARLVHGHMDWRTVEQIDPDKAFTFTFLREPRERLISHYHVLPLLTETLADSRLKCVAKAAHGRSPVELARSRDPIILAHIDNYMVRALAGSVHDYPIACADWPKLFDRALTNLRSLNFVGFQDSFDSDFATLLERLNLPQTRDFKPLNRRQASKEHLDINPAFYEWDQKLVDASRGSHQWYGEQSQLTFSV